MNSFELHEETVPLSDASHMQPGNEQKYSCCVIGIITVISKLKSSFDFISYNNLIFQHEEAT